MPTKVAPMSKREELLEVASQLFYEQGFGATGVKQIIDTAGIAKGTFYSHYESKEALGVAWLKKRHALWMQWMQAELEKQRTARGKILALFDFLEGWMERTAFRGCAFLNTLSEIPNPDHEMRVEIAAHKRGLQESIQSLVGDHFSARTATFVRQKAAIVFLLFEGALVEAQNFGEAWPIAAARKEVKAMLSTQS